MGKIQALQISLGIAAFVQSARILYYSKAARYTLAACFLGLSLARLTHSVSLFLLTGNPGQTIQRHEIRPGTESVSGVADASSVIGGALFGKSEMASKVASEPASLKPFKLVGTLEGEPDVARALIDVQGQGTREYCAYGNSCKKGDCLCAVEGVKIVQIAKESIIVRSGGQIYALKIGENIQDLKLNQSPDTVKNSTIPVGEKTIAQILSREQFRRMFKEDMEKILKGNFFPHFEKGQITGYRIQQIPADNPLVSLGARNGDIIRRINGYSLNDMERMMDLLKYIPTMNELKVELERSGKIVFYEFQIRN
jgi:general secretion pathway protein C